MTNFKKLPICISVALLFTLSINGCISYKAVQIKEIKSVQPLNNNLSSGKMVVNLRVANPNNYSIKVKKYNLHAFVNNTDLGEIKVDEKIVLPKNSEQDYKLTFATDMNKIIGLIPSLFLQGGGEAALKGSVRIKALFLSKKFSVDLKKKVRASDFK